MLLSAFNQYYFCIEKCFTCYQFINFCSYNFVMHFHFNRLDRSQKSTESNKLSEDICAKKYLLLAVKKRVDIDSWKWNETARLSQQLWTFDFQWLRKGQGDFFVGCFYLIELTVPFISLRAVLIQVSSEGMQIALKGYSSQWEIHSIYLHLYNILVVHSNCAQRSLINN